MTDNAVLEFTVEPFVPANPGPHVLASIEAARETATSVEVGPFGTTATGDTSEIATIAQQVIAAALANGASRVSLQISTGQTGDDPSTMTEETR